MGEVIGEVVEVAGFGHEGVFVLSGFGDAGRFASGAFRHLIVGDGPEQILAALAGLAGVGSAPNCPLPLVEPGNGSGEDS